MNPKNLPRIGLGTWQLHKQDCTNSVKSALEMGYRFIDTAQLYNNEEYVGKGIIESGIDREDFLLATKISFFNIRTKKLEKSFLKSLKKLQTDYVDILYVHWPVLFYKAEKTIPIFNKLVQEGSVRHIGVSNFTISHLKDAKKYADPPIFANQIEMHPFLQQNKIRKYMDKESIYTVAYSPLARGEVFNHPLLQNIASKYETSVAQLSLAWIMEQGATPIPKATSQAHLEDNFQATKLQIYPEDIEKINRISKEKRMVKLPLISPDWD